MPRQSTVDKHAERQAIEFDLARSVPLRKIEKRYGVHIDALWRHRKKMRAEQPEIFAQLAAADWKVKPEELEKLRTETADGWLKVLRGQAIKLMLVQDRNIESGNDGIAAQAGAQVLKALDMVGRAVDQLGATATTVNNIQNNISLSADFWQFRQGALRVLAPFPEARSAFIAFLRETAAEQDEPAPKALAGPVIEHSA